MTKKRIVIVGGGLAGKVLATNLIQNEAVAKIILIEPKEYFEVPFGQLRGLVDPENFGSIIRKPLKDLLPGVEIIHTLATKITNEMVHLKSGEQIEYDFLVLATGSRFRNWPFLKGMEPSVSERQDSFVAEGGKIALAQSVLIVGGGPVGVELAGEIADKWPEKKISLVQGGDRLLNALDKAMSRHSKKLLEKMGVDVYLDTKLTKSNEGLWVDSNGKEFAADIVFPAVGMDINTDWMGSEIPKNEKGAVMVQRDLRVKGKNTVFAIGDINDVPELKIGAFAVKQAALTAKNIKTLLKDPEVWLKAYKPQKDLSMVTIGPQWGAVQLPLGHPHFMIKIKQKDLFTSMYLQ